MKNLKMIHAKRVYDIELKEEKAVAEAKKEKAAAYIALLNEALGDGKTLLRGFVRECNCVYEATLRLARAELMSDYSVYVEMVDIETNKSYAFMNVEEILRDFVVVEKA